MSADELQFRDVDQDDPLAAPLLAELAVEYSTRYGGGLQRHRDLLVNYPAQDFVAPDGRLVVGVIDDEPVVGGAFRRFDTETAELKRIWTDSRYRRRGYARRVLAELEREIAARGYRRIYLMTGDRQPEAEALYTACGYTRLAEPLGDPPAYPVVAFEKRLP